MNGQTQQQQRVRVLPEISKLTLNEGRLNYRIYYNKTNRLLSYSFEVRSMRLHIICYSTFFRIILLTKVGLKQTSVCRLAIHDGGKCDPPVD